MRSTVVRGVPVPAVQVQDAPRHRLLPDPGLRAVDPDRDPVVGVVLDQRGREPGARVHRPADRADHDDHEQRRPVLPTPRLLHQGMVAASQRCSAGGARGAPVNTFAGSGTPLNVYHPNIQLTS